MSYLFCLLAIGFATRAALGAGRGAETSCFSASEQPFSISA
jgi:hypothetical protein